MTLAVRDSATGQLPPIYWINLERSSERRERMLGRFAARGLLHVRIAAVDGNDPQAVERAIVATNVPARVAACAASHLLAIQQAYEDGCEQALVLEDDMTFELLDAWPEGWAVLSRELPQRFGVVRLCVAETPRRLDALYRRPGWWLPVDKLYWSVGAYVIERDAMRLLLDRFRAGSRFDVSGFGGEQDPEHLILETLNDDASLEGPFDARIPLFVYEGVDSEIHSDQMPQYLRAREFILAHHADLRAGTYRSPFSLAASARAMVDWAWFLPRWAFDHATDHLGYYGGGPSDHRAKYMSQHALAYACDRHGGGRYVMWGLQGRDRLLDMSTYRDIRQGDVVWVRIEDLSRFNREILPTVKHRFVLVTAESDYTVPSDFPEPAREIASSGKLLHWFATNYDHSALEELITGLPLGLNYRKKHDLHWMQGRTLRRERLPVPQQEVEWETAASRALPIEKRLPLAFADFWLNNSSASRRYGESRDDIAAQLRENPNVFFPPKVVTHAELFAAYSRHAFVVSPHGRGLDCYRTWEALFAGCIVIVKKSPIDPLYRDLPVVIVDDWADLTKGNLSAWMARFGSGFDRSGLRATLSLQTWLQRIRARAAGVYVGS